MDDIDNMVIKYRELEQTLKLVVFHTQEAVKHVNECAKQTEIAAHHVKKALKNE